MAERKIKQEGGLGGGRLECDGKDHYWVVPEHAQLQCPKEVHVGPCPGGQQCVWQVPNPVLKKAKE